MGLLVYTLCAVTSFLCAALLLRGYRRSGSRLLLWSGLCFACFCVNNLLLIVDVRMLPERDLSVVRSIPALIGITLLVYGLVWESAE
jgi:hypothetical protein